MSKGEGTAVRLALTKANAIAEWGARVRADRRIDSAALLSIDELYELVPKLVDAIVEALRAGQNDAAPRAHVRAMVHLHRSLRCARGYSPAEIEAELALLRETLARVTGPLDAGSVYRLLTEDMDATPHCTA